MFSFFSMPGLKISLCAHVSSGIPLSLVNLTCQQIPVETPLNTVQTLLLLGSLALPGLPIWFCFLSKVYVLLTRTLQRIVIWLFVWYRLSTLYFLSYLAQCSPHRGAGEMFDE